MPVTLLLFLCVVTIASGASSWNEVNDTTNSWLDTSSNTWTRDADGAWQSSASLWPSELILDTINFVDASAHFTIECTYTAQFDSSSSQMLEFMIFNGASRTRCEGYRIGIYQYPQYPNKTLLSIYKVIGLNAFSQLTETPINTAPNQTPQTMTIDVLNGNEIRVSIDGVLQSQYTNTSNSSNVLDDGQNIGHLGFKAWNLEATISSLFVSGEKINAVAMNADDCVDVTVTTIALIPATTAQSTQTTTTDPTIVDSVTTTKSVQSTSDAVRTTTSLNDTQTVGYVPLWVPVVVCMFAACVCCVCGAVVYCCIGRRKRIDGNVSPSNHSNAQQVKRIEIPGHVPGFVAGFEDRKQGEEPEEGVELVLEKERFVYDAEHNYKREGASASIVTTRNNPNVVAEEESDSNDSDSNDSEEMYEKGVTTPTKKAVIDNKESKKNARTSLVF